METVCKYCQNSFVPKRTDSLYCSHSCRQLAYVLRKATGNTINGLKALPSKPDLSIVLQNKQELSIEIESREDYPSTKDEILAEPSNELIDNEHVPSIKEQQTINYPSITKNLPVKKETGLTVNTDKKEISMEIKAINSIIKNKGEQQQYKEYSSPLVNQIAELTEERNNLNILFSLLHNNKETASYWISLRYRCLVECLLTFSEMQFIDIDDLKEVCNAFTAMIQSRPFSYLIPKYPYTDDIIQLRDSIKNQCLNADEEERFTLRFKKETKLKLIATRWELANFFPKINFAQLNFTE